MEVLNLNNMKTKRRGTWTIKTVVYIIKNKEDQRINFGLNNLLIYYCSNSDVYILI